MRPGPHPPPLRAVPQKRPLSPHDVSAGVATPAGEQLDSAETSIRAPLPSTNKPASPWHWSSLVESRTRLSKSAPPCLSLSEKHSSLVAYRYTAAVHATFASQVHPEQPV